MVNIAGWGKELPGIGRGVCTKTTEGRLVDEGRHKFLKVSNRARQQGGVDRCLRDQKKLGNGSVVVID